MMNKKLVIYVFVLFACSGFLLRGEVMAQFTLPQGDSHEYYYRLLQISGVAEERASFEIRPFAPANRIQTVHPWLHEYRTEGVPFFEASFGGKLYFYEPVWFQSYNTALPRGAQDGAIWQGKGYNTALSAGFYAHAGPVHISFRPQIGIAQNQNYDLGPYNPPTINTQYYSGEAGGYAYRSFRGIIDQPLRFGDATYSWASLGESSVEVRFHDFSIALSNQRLWTGPGIHNSLQFGYNGPGFAHLSLGTYRPLETGIGAFEFRYIFGGIRKSDFYNEHVRDLHSINSLQLSYSPPFAPGLSVGAIRTYFHSYPRNFSDYRYQAGKLFEAAVRRGLQSEESPDGYNVDNQVASVYMRWHFPESGFEAYAEYGRNDHNTDLRDFRIQPDHHRAYMLGILKSLKLDRVRLLAIGMEIMQGETPRSSLTRGNANLGGWYTHAQQAVGFTNRGQILGSGHGPGANVQMAYGDLFDQQGRVGITLARVVHHNSLLDQHFERIQAANENDVERWQVRKVEFMGGIRGTVFLEYGLEVTAALEQSFILNQHYLLQNDITNTRFEITVRKQVGGWLR